MIHVLAIITATPGNRDRVLETFRSNVEAVRAEPGCIEYVAAIDSPEVANMADAFGRDTFVVIEKWEDADEWEDADALKTHARTPHMLAYAARVKEWTENRVIHILSPA